MNISSRMESTSEELRIQCSEKAKELAVDQDESLKFAYRGKVSIKGKGLMRTYWVDATIIPGFKCAGDPLKKRSRTPEFKKPKERPFKVARTL